MATGRERMQELRWRRQMQGIGQKTVWLDQDSFDRLQALRRPGETTSQVVQRALWHLEAQALPPHVWVAGAPPTPVTSDDRPPRRPTLTPDQAMLVALWNQGLEIKAIAAKLGIHWPAAQSRARRLQQRGLIAPRPRGGDYPSRRAQARPPPESR